ncbi:MAG: adenosylmethionine--8-amino-7-oxononanoate transaminase [Burkholderiales bacterium]
MSDGNADWIARSRAAVWHPCTQMKVHETLPLVPVARGEGAWLVDFEGNRFLDAVSSWWVNLFGHSSARIKDAIRAQLDALPHAMLAGFTHRPAVELSERLHAQTGLGHAFYGSDGASATEIALKMSFHYWRNSGHADKRSFVCLAGSYHGETVGALSVTDVAIFHDTYAPLLASNVRMPFPRDVEAAAAALDAHLARHHATTAALIVEPLVQGASGMRMYDPRYLALAREITARHGVHLIADEIMTGFGRTGTLFAWEQAGTARPDFMCLSKGITGGHLPLSCVLTTDEVYAAFYDDDVARAFLHSHSYTGNPLACAAAVAVLDIFREDDVIARNRALAQAWAAALEPVRAHPRVRDFRQRGMILAWEVDTTRPGFAARCFAQAMAGGVLLRPIGNTVYVMPPYIVTADEMGMVASCIQGILDRE